MPTSSGRGHRIAAVARFDSLRNIFSFLGGRSRAEEVVAAYLIREHNQGRSVEEILADPYVVNRLTPEQIRRLLDRPDVLHALGSSSSSS
jgi:hypothetical protein